MRSGTFGFWAALFLGLTIGGSVHAAALRDFNVQVEPVVGFERAYSPLPSPRTKVRLLYGLRATAGYSILSGELEATRASDSETFPSQGLTVDETSDKVKLGLRSGIYRSFGAAFFRAGGQAQRVSRTQTAGGVPTQSQDPISIDPYAGIGAELGGANIRLTGSATVVFRDLQRLSQNELETTIGLRIGR